MTLDNLLQPSPTVNFADVAHNTLIFDKNDEASKLVLELIDTKWVQRLRRIRQTGNTHLVYMYAEHSRFGHSLGVAYLSLLLMKNLERFEPKQVQEYKQAVAAAALLHDIGHIAPGSHLAAHIWSADGKDEHELVSTRIIKEDPEISAILAKRSDKLADLVEKILMDDPSLPSWTHAIISGGGWNADRGNWTIVDSAMCSVSYGRYNVAALIDAFRLSPDGQLILQESRLDALTHFFVARDSMYRQVYQHRVLQAADSMVENVIRRLRNIIGDSNDVSKLDELNIFYDETLKEVLTCHNYGRDLNLDTIFKMTEDWWAYHREAWCKSNDKIIKDLSTRLRDRGLFKTVRLNQKDPKAKEELVNEAKKICETLGYDPSYYLLKVGNTGTQRRKSEKAPKVLRDDGTLVNASEIEPIIESLNDRYEISREWIAIPKEVKEKLGRYR